MGLKIKQFVVMDNIDIGILAVTFKLKVKAVTFYLKIQQ